MFRRSTLFVPLIGAVLAALGSGDAAARRPHNPDSLSSASFRAQRPAGPLFAAARMQAPADDEDPEREAIVQYPRIQEFRGDYRYRALDDRVVLRDNPSGVRAVVRVRGRGFPVAARYLPALEKDPELRGRLGVSLSDDTPLFDGRLHAQLFQGGCIVWEKESGLLWWGWHAPRDLSRLPEGGPGAPAALPTTEVLDETGAVPEEQVRDVRAAVRAFRARTRVALGVVFLPALPEEEAGARTKLARARLIEAGVLPQESALFAVAADRRFLWHRDNRINALVSWEAVQAAWKGTPTDRPLPDRVVQFLARLAEAPLAGGPGATPHQPPVDTTQAAKVLTPGPVLAERTIGPEGGTLPAPPAGVVLDVPAGALPEPEKITLRAAQATLPGCGFVFLERVGKGAFRKPVRLAMTLPAGVDGARTRALHQVSGDLWGIEAASWDASTRTLSTELSHFSGAGWFDPLDRKTWLLGGAGLGSGVGAAGVGTYLVITTGSLLSSITVPMAAVVFVCAAAGAFGGSSAFDAYRSEGLEGPLPAEGFALGWKAGEVTGGYVYALVDRRTDRLLRMVPPDFFEGPSLPGGGSTLEIPNWSGRPEDLKRIQVPLSVMRAGGYLQQARRWYREAGYSVPDEMPALIHSKITAGDSGEFDGRALHLRSGQVNVLQVDPPAASADQERRRDLLATMAHEYWHAVFKHNGWREPFAGADDCFATTYESTVFVPSSTEFLDGYSWKSVAPFLANGLVVPGANEGLARTGQRGYRLWPWGKFLYHNQGDAVIRELLSGQMSPGNRSALFRLFTRALLTREHRLGDPETVRLPSDWTVSVVTGWGRLKLDELYEGATLLPLGRTEMLPVRPLALKLALLEVPASAPHAVAYRLVVRRAQPDPTEEITLLPPPAPGSSIQPAPTTADLESSTRAVVVESQWVSSTGAAARVPMALVGLAAEPLPGRVHPLLSYRLAPPSDLKRTEKPAASPADGKTKLEWGLPPAAPNLGLAEVYAGYRIYGRDEKGKVTLVAELLFPPATIPSASVGWYTGSADLKVTVQPDQRSVELPAARLAGYATLGMASIDGVVKDGSGQPLLSPVQWLGPPAAEGLLVVTVNEPKPADLSTYNPFEVLSGKPIPGAPVALTYAWQGKQVRLEAVTDRKGECRFTKVPVGIDLTVTHGKEVKQVRIPATSGRFGVLFGWGGHEVKPPPVSVPTDPGLPVPVPPPPK